MAQRVVEIDGIGPVTIAKRRGTRNLRISINAKGRIRVGLPVWLPYQAGVEFARSHRHWIDQKLKDRPARLLRDGDQVGKAHRLRFMATASAKTTSRLKAGEIEIRTNLPFDSSAVQAKAITACERALKLEADKLLPQRLEALSNKHGFDYRDLKIRKLTSRWGSCSSRGVITLSYLLIQLPWHLIDYVLIHELVHTVHMNHSRSFWQAFEAAMPNVKQLRKEIRQLQPHLMI